MAGETAAVDPVRHGKQPAAALLPPDPVPFVGRQAQLAALRAEVVRPGFSRSEPAGAARRSRVLVVAGRPGSGRTALAVRFARTAAADYPDGQLFARLGGADGRRIAPGQAARHLLAALGEDPAAVGLPADPGTDDAAADAADPACSALRRALTGRRVVLVLDDVQDAAQLEPLIPDEPGCLVVATAAGPLTGIADARPCVLGGLDPASAVALLTGLVGETRIVCDPVGAAELAEACGCHPGALRLAAGWLRTRPRAAVPDAVQALADTSRREPAGDKDHPPTAGQPTGAGASAGRAPTPDADSGVRPAPPRQPAAAHRPTGGPDPEDGGDYLSVWQAVTSATPLPAPAPGSAAAPDHLSVWEVLVSGTAAPGPAAVPPVDPDGAARPGPDAAAYPERPERAPAVGVRAAPPEPVPSPPRPPDAASGTDHPPAPEAAACRAPSGPTSSGRAVAAAVAVPQARDAREAGAAGEPQGPPTGDPLHRAFALLYRGLPSAHARMLRLLVLAPEGVADRRTASALAGCPAGSAEHILRVLAEQQLLEEEPAAPDGTVRYRLPSRLHALLARLLAEAERPAETELARARLLERLVRLVDSCRALLAPEPDRPAPEPLPGALRLHSAAHARDWLGREQPVLCAAARDAVAAADLDGPADRLVGALVRTLPAAGAVDPAVLYELHGLVLAVARRGGSPGREAAALVNLGTLLAAAGDHRRALERCHAALEPARAAGDEAAVARVLEAVAGAHRALGDAVRSADWYARALAARRVRGEPREEARLTARLAEALAGQRRFEEAAREYRASLALLRRLGDDAARVAVGLEAARALLRAGEPEQALFTHREALAVARLSADPALESRALLALAETLERTGDPEGARLHRAQAARVPGLE